eukprot:5959607-Amphidinium_carterae.1
MRASIALKKATEWLMHLVRQLTQLRVPATLPWNGMVYRCEGPKKNRVHIPMRGASSCDSHPRAVQKRD